MRMNIRRRHLVDQPGGREAAFTCLSNVRILNDDDELRSALDRAETFERVILGRINGRLSGFETHRTLTAPSREAHDKSAI
jgi:hypothetical protein